MYVRVSGVCAQWGWGRLGRGKCTGKESLRTSDSEAEPAAFLCVLEDEFTEDVTQLFLFVHKPSPLLLEFN